MDQIYFSLGEIRIPVGYKAGIGGSFLLLFLLCMLYPSLILISERSNRQFIRLSLFYFTPDFLLHHHHDTVVQLAGCTVVQPGELSPRPVATLTDQHHCKYAVPTITLHLLCPDHSVSRNTPWWAFLCRVSNIRRVINCF